MGKYLLPGRGMLGYIYVKSSLHAARPDFFHWPLVARWYGQSAFLSNKELLALQFPTTAACQRSHVGRVSRLGAPSSMLSALD